MSLFFSSNTANSPVKVKYHRRISEWEAFIAVSNKEDALVAKMLRKKLLDPNLDFKGTTLITEAIHQNSINILTLLLIHGGSPDKKSNENGRFEPPIITATRLKNIEIVKLLVEYGANILATNFYGENLLYQAVVSNAFEILIYYLETKSEDSIQNSRKLWRIFGWDNVTPCCALRLAIQEAEKYPSKLKCLKLFFKYHYICGCSLQHSSHHHHEEKFATYKNSKIIKELFKWGYLAYGDDIFYRMKNSPKSIPITLSNLVRISIRSNAKMQAVFNGTTFYNEILKLSLPSTLINFLLMSDLTI